MRRYHCSSIWRAASWAGSISILSRNKNSSRVSARRPFLFRGFMSSRELLLLKMLLEERDRELEARRRRLEAQRRQLEALRRQLEDAKALGPVPVPVPSPPDPAQS